MELLELGVGQLNLDQSQLCAGLYLHWGQRQKQEPESHGYYDDGLGF